MVLVKTSKPAAISLSQEAQPKKPRIPEATAQLTILQANSRFKVSVLECMNEP